MINMNDSDAGCSKTHQNSFREADSRHVELQIGDVTSSNVYVLKLTPEVIGTRIQNRKRCMIIAMMSIVLTLLMILILIIIPGFVVIE